jgi:hypothetical protein
VDAADGGAAAAAKPTIAVGAGVDYEPQPALLSPRRGASTRGSGSGTGRGAGVDSECRGQPPLRRAFERLAQFDHAGDGSRNLLMSQGGNRRRRRTDAYPRRSGKPCRRAVRRGRRDELTDRLDAQVACCRPTRIGPWR